MLTLLDVALDFRYPLDVYQIHFVASLLGPCLVAKDRISEYNIMQSNENLIM